MSLQEQFWNASDRTKLDPSDKALFLEEWDLKDGDLTDEQSLTRTSIGASTGCVPIVAWFS